MRTLLEKCSDFYNWVTTFVSLHERKKNTKTHMPWDGVKLNKWDFHGKSVWNKSAVKLTDCTCMSNCATTEFWLTRYPRGSRNAHSMEQCNLRKEHTASIWTHNVFTFTSTHGCGRSVICVFCHTPVEQLIGPLRSSCMYRSWNYSLMWAVRW